MKSRLTAVAVCLALQSAIPAPSHEQKPNDAHGPGAVAVTHHAESQADRIDDYVKAEMTKRQIPGLALGIVRNGDLVRARGYGKSNLETDSGVSPQSVFDLASLTKPFTAEAVMMLVADGKLHLEDSVSLYVNGLPAGWDRITISQLLSHTSGLPELFLDDTDPKAPKLLDRTTADQFSALTKLQLLFTPGTRGQYSDPGYFLLGMVIEKASGMRWGDFLSSRIFTPLHMDSTSVTNQWLILKNRVSCYTLGPQNQLMNARRVWQVELPSAFGIWSSVEDLAKWDRSLREASLLKRETLERMWTPARLSNGHQSAVFDRPYGLGWALGQFHGQPIAEHGGFTGTEMLRFLDNGITIVILSNLDVRSGNRPSELARGVFSLLAE